MGRQINFYMSDKLFEDFTDLLISKGFIFLDSSGNEYGIKEPRLKTFLYKKEYGEPNYLKSKKTSKETALDCDSPMIEYFYGKVRHEDKKIGCSRLWMSTNVPKEYIKDYNSLVKDYNSLVRWVKKNAPYQEILVTHIRGTQSMCKKYISNDIIELTSEQGYILL